MRWDTEGIFIREKNRSTHSIPSSTQQTLPLWSRRIQRRLQHQQETHNEKEMNLLFDLTTLNTREFRSSETTTQLQRSENLFNQSCVYSVFCFLSPLLKMRWELYNFISTFPHISTTFLSWKKSCSMHTHILTVDETFEREDALTLYFCMMFSSF